MRVNSSLFDFEFRMTRQQAEDAVKDIHDYLAVVREFMPSPSRTDEIVELVNALNDFIIYSEDNELQLKRKLRQLSE